MRKRFKAALIGAVSATALAASAAGAAASTTPWVEYVAGNGNCYGKVVLTGTNQDYAQGWFHNLDTGISCDFWLERATIVSGVTGQFEPIGSYSTTPDTIYSSLTQDHSMWTGEYWDGPDYRVRVCMRVTGTINGWCSTDSI